MLHVGVIGPSDARDDEVELAYTVGELLALRAVTVLVGGVAGVSRAAADGAQSRGGLVVGLAPTHLRSTVDLPARVVIPTGLGEMSNALLVRASDALVCVGGGWGTMLEVCLALRTRVPVVGLQAWSVVDSAGRPVDGPVMVATPAEAVDLACRLGQRRLAADHERPM